MCHPEDSISVDLNILCKATVIAVTFNRLIRLYPAKVRSGGRLQFWGGGFINIVSVRVFHFLFPNIFRPEGSWLSANFTPAPLLNALLTALIQMRSVGFILGMPMQSLQYRRFFWDPHRTSEYGYQKFQKIKKTSPLVSRTGSQPLCHSIELNLVASKQPLSAEDMRVRLPIVCSLMDWWKTVYPDNMRT